MLLIYILILVFIILIGYQTYLAIFSNKLIEGLENDNTITNSSNTQEYKPYNLQDPNNSLILAQQNAGNIEVLKGRIDSFDGVKQKVDEMQQNINSMQTQIDGLVEQQANYAQEIAGSTPPEVTGTEPETVENVENSIEENEKNNYTDQNV
jgi:flagellar basal body-associated protein FliL